MHALRAVALLLALAAPLAAEEDEGRLLYSWTSDDGTVHYTDDLNRVPEKFRANPKTFIARESNALQRVVPTAPAKAETPASEPTEQYEGWLEADWRSAAKGLDEAIVSLAPVVAECEKDHVNLSPGDGSRKRREEEEEARRCGDARAAYAKARADREALNERAHRAGVPPGWVRGE